MPRPTYQVPTLPSPKWIPSETELKMLTQQYILADFEAKKGFVVKHDETGTFIIFKSRDYFIETYEYQLLAHSQKTGDGEELTIEEFISKYPNEKKMVANCFDKTHPTRKWQQKDGSWVWNFLELKNDE